jgi:hypothetical protein
VSGIYPVNPNIIVIHNFMVTAILQTSKKIKVSAAENSNIEHQQLGALRIS